MSEDGKRKKSRWVMISFCLVIFGCCLFSLYLGWKLLIYMGRSMAECPTKYTVITWLDHNSNGIRDFGEPPFPDVNTIAGFVIPDSPREWVSARTDQNGESQVWFMTNGNTTIKYGRNINIYTEIPPGYSITTPSNYTTTVCERGAIYYFGFLPQPDLEAGP